MANNNTELNNCELLLKSVAKVVSSYVRNHKVTLDDLPNVIDQVHNKFTSLINQADSKNGFSQKPAVPIENSITDEHMICLEDGKKLKMLKRYLRTRYSLSPEDYRSKWGLPADYPMVAPGYAARRSEFAKQIGLGTNRKKNKS
ncbi:MAG: MucR family transcriptional regulator [Sphingomonadales bacterium]|nr:MucR family transcriptional regulator [Sphingomonadales bacterium]